MADINQIIESLGHLPNGINNPIAAAGSLAVALVVRAVERGVYKQTDETWAAQFPNEALLNESLTVDPKRARRVRLAPAMAVTAGIGVLAFQIIGNPTYESTSPDRSASVVVVDDVSLSMLNTKDVGTSQETRSGVVNIALQEASYAGKLGIVQSGAKFATTLPLGVDWKTHLAQAEKPKVDPNGGNLVDAINAAASLLPLKNDKHVGNLLVISDGTIDDSATEIAATATALNKEGVTVRVIVPGTAQGKYLLGASRQQILSGATAGVFTGFGAKNVIEAKDAKSINKAIKETLLDAGTSHENHTWYAPGIIGALLLGGGILRDKTQRATRKI